MHGLNEELRRHRGREGKCTLVQVQVEAHVQLNNELEQVCSWEL